jgi:hypothetical protein
MQLDLYSPRFDIRHSLRLDRRMKTNKQKNTICHQTSKINHHVTSTHYASTGPLYPSPRWLARTAMTMIYTNPSVKTTLRARYDERHRFGGGGGILTIQSMQMPQER